MSKGEKRKRKRKRSDVFFYLTLHGIVAVSKTLLAAVGAHTYLNIEQIADLKAQVLLQEQARRDHPFEGLEARKDRLSEECAFAEQRLVEQSRFDTAQGLLPLERSNEFYRLHLLRQLKCERAEAVQTEFEKLKGEFDEQLINIENTSRKRVFLAQNHPELYQEYFDDDGQMKNKGDLVRYAMKGFFGALSSGDYDAISISGIFALLSVLTSGGAVLSTVFLALSRDVKQSHHLGAIEYQKRLLAEAKREIAHGHHQQSN